jgi:hypothetical protein
MNAVVIVGFTRLMYCRAGLTNLQKLSWGLAS